MQNQLTHLTKTRYQNSFELPEIYFHTGNALDDHFDFSDATIVFVNNWCFGGELEHDLFVKFQKILPAGVKIVCLKDAFPRYRPNSLRCDDLPCHRFRYPWRKFESCDDAISWDSRLVECVIYQVYDSICSLSQANSLIHSLTISDCSFSVISKPRLMFVDEARAFLKPVLIENFEANDVTWEGSIDDNVGIIIDKMRNQKFKSTFIHLRKQPDRLIIRSRQLKINTFSVVPRVIEIALREKDKIAPITDATVISEEDFNKSYEEQKQLHANASKPISHLFLRRNFGELSHRKGARPLNFTFGRRPFSLEQEHEEFLIRIKKARHPSAPVQPNAPRLAEGKYPNWVAPKPPPPPPPPVTKKPRAKPEKQTPKSPTIQPYQVIEFQAKFPPTVPPSFTSFPAAAGNPSSLLLTRRSLRAMQDAALFMHIPPPAPSKEIKKKPPTKPKARATQSAKPKQAKTTSKKKSQTKKRAQSKSLTPSKPPKKNGHATPKNGGKSVATNGEQDIQCIVYDSKLSPDDPPIFLKRTLTLTGKKRKSLPAERTTVTKQEDDAPYKPPSPVTNKKMKLPIKDNTQTSARRSSRDFLCEFDFYVI